MIDGMLDLFAGSGVGVAAHNLGVTEYGVENMKAAVATREAAGFLTPYNDAWEVDRPHELGLQFNTLWASPPCQSFSAAGKGKGRKALDNVLQAIRDSRYTDINSLRQLGVEVGDERTALVLTPLAYIYRYTPTYIALEQVPTVLPVWEEYATVLREWGYSVWTGYLHSEQYGVPQTRKRAYLIARKDGVQATSPTPTHSRYYPHDPTRLDVGVKKWVSMYEGLDWGTNRQSPFTAASRREAWVITGGATSERYVERSVFFPAPTITGAGNTYTGVGERFVRGEGGGKKKNPDSFSLPPSETSILQGYPRAWGLTNQPSPTITSHLGVTRSPSGTQRVYLDAIERGEFQFKPVSPKPSTVAENGIGAKFAPNTVNIETDEGGALQGYPRSFPFQGSKTAQHLQVGNAVPPPVAEAVLRTFMEDSE